MRSSRVFILGVVFLPSDDVLAARKRFNFDHSETFPERRKPREKQNKKGKLFMHKVQLPPVPIAGLYSIYTGTRYLLEFYVLACNHVCHPPMLSMSSSVDPSKTFTEIIRKPMENSDGALFVCTI